MTTRLMELSEFLRRRKLARSTFFEMKKEGRFVEGIHYTYQGRALRFPFPSSIEAPLENPQKQKVPAPAEPRVTKSMHSRRYGRSLDPDYQP